MVKQSREEEAEKLKDGGPSEYTHLNELKSEGEWEGGRRSFGSKSNKKGIDGIFIWLGLF